MFERRMADNNDPMNVLAGSWELAVGEVVRRHLVDISPGEKLVVKILN